MNTGRASQHTIRQWFALLVVACILPATLAATLLIANAYQRERAMVEQAAIETARALMQAVDRELSSAQGTLQALAASPALAAGDLAAFHLQAREALRYWAGSNIVVNDASGQQLINTLSPFGAPLPRHGNPLQLQHVIRTGEPAVSNLYMSAVANRSQISIDVPVRRGNQVTHVLSMGFFPERLGEILERQRPGADRVVAIFDSNGVVVARTHQPQQWVGRQGAAPLLERMKQATEGSVETDTLEGIPVIANFSRSTFSNWAVAIGIARATLVAELWKSISRVVAGTLLLLLLGLVLAKIVGDRITRSMRALVRPAMALGYGDPVVVPALKFKEADDLGHAMIKAAELLRARTAERDRAEQAEQDLRMLKQQLEQSEALQRGIFEQAPDALLLVDSSGRIVRANAEAEKLFGYPRDRLYKLSVEDLIPDDVRQRHVALRESFFKAPVRRPMASGMALLGRRADGSDFPVDVMLSPLQAGEGHLVIATIRDVTEQRRNEEALRESEKRFRSTLEHAPIGMSVVSPDGRWIEVNNAMCELVGYDKVELQNLTVEKITHPEDVEKDREAARQLLRGDVRSSQLEKRYIHKDGRVVTVMLTRSLLRDDNGTPVYFIAQIEDISERKLAQEQLKMLNNRLALATQAGGIAVWELDLRTGEMWWDQRMYELYRVSAERPLDVWHLWRQSVHPDHIVRVERELDAATRSGGMFVTEYPIMWPDGQIRIIRANGVVSRDPEGQAICMTGINWDVTEIRQKEEAISAALREKETLLKELYHRVKNNLQVITSLFNLQVRTMPDESARTALKEGADRVRAMALVHEKLYQSKNLSSISLDEYIADLCRQLGNAAGADDRGIMLVTQAEPIQVGLETAVPLGLLLNELISNSLKHAFPEGRRGQVVVRLACLSQGVAELSVADDGVGFPAGLNPTFSQTLGLKLVYALTSQLDGKLVLENRQGAHAGLSFRIGPRVEAGGATTKPAATT